jgi:magnesium-transporting ATPase (P-type)
MRHDRVALLLCLLQNVQLSAATASAAHAQVNEGSGHMLVTAVGPNSEWGKTMLLVAEAGDDETPLQGKLTIVATQVSKMGVAVGILCFFALFIKCVNGRFWLCALQVRKQLRQA